MSSALATLAASAALIGAVASPPLPAPTYPIASDSGLTILARASLSEISKAQSNADLRADLGTLPLTARASFDPDGILWVTLSRGSWSGAYDEVTLTRGLQATTPEGPLQIKLDAISLHVMTDAGTSAVFGRNALVERLHGAALKIEFAPVTYALLYEDGSGTPASLCLLRKNEKGDYFVTHRTLSEMSKVHWFLGKNMLLYGMRIEGSELVFVSKPVPPEKTP